MGERSGLWGRGPALRSIHRGFLGPKNGMMMGSPFTVMALDSRGEGDVMSKEKGRERRALVGRCSALQCCHVIRRSAPFKAITITAREASFPVPSASVSVTVF